MKIYAVMVLIWLYNSESNVMCFTHSTALTCKIVGLKFWDRVMIACDYVWMTENEKLSVVILTIFIKLYVSNIVVVVKPITFQWRDHSHHTWSAWSVDWKLSISSDCFKFTYILIKVRRLGLASLIFRVVYLRAFLVLFWNKECHSSSFSNSSFACKSHYEKKHRHTIFGGF